MKGYRDDGTARFSLKMGNAMTSFKKAFDKMFGNKEMRVRSRECCLPHPRFVCPSLILQLSTFYFTFLWMGRTTPPLARHDHTAPAP